MVSRTSRLSKNLTTLFGSSGASECRVCKNPLHNHRRKYCSDRCQRIAYAVVRCYRWEHIREFVLERDGSACVNPDCTNDAATPDVSLHVDHVHPLADDGPAHDPANLQTLCDACNTAKGTDHTDYRPAPVPDGGTLPDGSPEAELHAHCAAERDPETPTPDLTTMSSDLTLDDLPQPEFEGTVPPDELSTDGDNPNEQPDEMFGLLCDRIRQRGWLGGPIIADGDGLIADGEHRWRAAKEIGLAEVPVKFYDISDEKRRLIRQELNKISGDHDRKRDALEYDLLLDNGLSEDVTALTEAAGEDLDELLSEIRMDTATPPEYEYDPDHNVYFEDCVEGMRDRLDDDSVDMVFTSPPYNVDLDRDDRAGGMVSYADAKTDSEYMAFLDDVLAELARVVKPGGHIFINHQNDIRGGTLDPQHWLIEACPLPLRSYIIWNKGDYAPTSVAGLNSSGQYYPSWEPIFHFSDAPNGLNGTKNYSVWDISPISGDERQSAGAHPAPFPTELVSRAITSATTEGGLVLDPFMGSGTTAVAAVQTHRDYVGFELDEDDAYKPIIERRIGEAKRQRDAAVNDADTDETTADADD